jgi:hypothetical protein
VPLLNRDGLPYDQSDGVIYQPPFIRRAVLRGASPWVLNTRGTPALGSSWQADAPSVYQGFPADADTLLRWLGAGVYPAGFAVGDVAAIYLVNTATPLVDSLGLGPNLVAANGPLTGRECVGLGQTASFTSKVGIEFTGAVHQNFADAGVAFGNVAAGHILSFLIVFRVNPAEADGSFDRFFEKAAATGYEFDIDAGGISLYNFGGASGCILGGTNFRDGAWHVAVVVLDCVAPIRRLLTDLGNGAPFGAAPGAIAAAAPFCLGSTAWNPAKMQVAYFAAVNKEITSAMMAAFWRHGQLPIPFLHARSSPMIAPITASRVAAWAAGNVGQPCLAYSASLVTATEGNGQGSGYMAEDGITFEPVGSTDFYTNTTVGAGGAKASVDGPSGMRDGVRYTMGGIWRVWAAYIPVGGVPIVGVSNIPWRSDINYRRATVNTTGRLGLYFGGSAAGVETFTLISDAATPVDWVRGGGTCTPVNADQNVVYVEFGSAALGDNCEFGELTLVKNRATSPLAWRRAPLTPAAAVSTVLPAYEAVNTGNYLYNPLKGKERIIVGAFAGGAGATFLRFGAPGGAGSLLLDYNAGPQLRLQVWDAAAALALTILGGPLSGARHVIDIEWDTQAPLSGIGGAYAAVTVDGVVVGAWLAPWTPAVAAVTPLWWGSNGGVNAARCIIEEG